MKKRKSYSHTRAESSVYRRWIKDKIRELSPNFHRKCSIFTFPGCRVDLNCGWIHPAVQTRRHPRCVPWKQSRNRSDLRAGTWICYFHHLVLRMLRGDQRESMHGVDGKNLKLSIDITRLTILSIIQYAFFLLVLVVAQIVLAVYAFMYTEELANASRNGFNKLWADMATNNNAGSREAIYGIQRGLQCCGQAGPADWTSALGGVPNSCCASDQATCNASNAFQKGCGNLLFDAVNGSGMLIAWVAVVFAGFEVKTFFYSLTTKRCSNCDSYLYSLSALSSLAA